jgi:Na+-transporting NADH:ubiquinone oxidoreductase subunit B
MAHGALYFLPLYIVTMVVGLTLEVLFAVVRGIEVNEGFFVTGLLYPLILPPDLPLWMAALGISFGVVIAKEVFGGTGMNFINPALAARAFVFFAYPSEMSGDDVWVAAPVEATVDGWTAATPLAEMRLGYGPIETQGLSWWDAFLGFIPGSMGETSALACLIGAVIIIVTGVGSWRTMAAVVVGTIGMSSLFNLVGSETNPFYAMPFWWHMVLGSWAFATVFMVTDPVTSPFTDAGKWVYGIIIGAMIVLIRVVNPSYPESVMLVILFMNVMAPMIDHVFVRGNIKRRMARRG